MNDFLITRIDLLRHGACEGGEIFRGHYDVALTEEGRDQMQRRVHFFSNRNDWDLVLSSPLTRCLTFSQALSTQRNLPLVIDQDLSECHFGDWEGQAIAEVVKTNPQRFHQWREAPDTNCPPNGENFHAFTSRVISSWETQIEKHKGKRILCVTHGGVIRVVLAHILKSTTSNMNLFDVPYACLSRIVVFHGGAGQKDIIQLNAHNLPSLE